MPTTNRREFLAESVLASMALTGITNAQQQPPAQKPASPGQSLPCGKLDNLQLSRIISGGNLLSGWCHQRDLLFVRQLAEAYLTVKKQFDTLEMTEEAGINTIMIDMMQLPIVNKYKRERKGKIQTMVSVRQDWGDWARPSLPNLRNQIGKAVDQGADMMFLHGGYCDRLVQSGKPEYIDFLAQALDCIRQQGVSAGLGSHALEVPLECEKRGIKVDYYVKSFHHDNYWSATPRGRRKRFCVDGPRSTDHNEFCDNIFCIDPEETAQFMANKKQPWVAYKVLAAGAIDPRSGLKYAFENGADFVALGMFDFNIAEDVLILKELLPTLTRPRPWMA